MSVKARASLGRWRRAGGDREPFRPFARSRRRVKARVLFVLPGFAANGPTRHSLDLASQLQSLGVEPEIFVLGPLELGEIPHGEIPPVRITSGNFPTTRRFRYRLPLLALRLFRAARRADVVFAAWPAGGPFLAAFLAARAARRPVITIVQSFAAVEIDHYIHGWMNRATKWVYPRIDRVVCVVEGLIPVATELGAPADRTRVIAYGSKPERIRRLARAEPPAWLPDGPFLVAVGRLAYAKAYDLLLRAHAEVRGAGLDHRLVFLGHGEEQEALEELARDLGVSDSVLFPGYLENPFPVIARAEALLAPSRFEGWGLMASESLCLGVPIIASQLPGFEAILDRGRYGELVERESVDAIVRAIETHLRDPHELRERAQAGREHADSLSVRFTARDYARLFEELSASPAREPAPAPAERPEPAIRRAVRSATRRMRRVPRPELRSMFLWARARHAAKDPSWRPEFAWGVLSAAMLAAVLGVEEICALELGVAGGACLLGLEAAAADAQYLLGVKLRVVGFDAASERGPPTDRVRRGPISETIPEFLRSEPPPIGFVSFELDDYSSTMDGLGLLEASPDRLLPQVFCCLTGTLRPPLTELGARAAIDAFNTGHELRKLSPLRDVKHSLPRSESRRPWPERLYVAEILDHEHHATSGLGAGS